MSFLRFLFDSDSQQRADIEELREMQFQMARASADWLCSPCARNP